MPSAFFTSVYVKPNNKKVPAPDPANVKLCRDTAQRINTVNTAEGITSMSGHLFLSIAGFVAANIGEEHMTVIRGMGWVVAIVPLCLALTRGIMELTQAKRHSDLAYYEAEGDIIITKINVPVGGQDVGGPAPLRAVAPESDSAALVADTGAGTRIAAPATLADDPDDDLAVSEDSENGNLRAGGGLTR